MLEGNVEFALFRREARQPGRVLRHVDGGRRAHAR